MKTPIENIIIVQIFKYTIYRLQNISMTDKNKTFSFQTNEILDFLCIN